jgi:hypothetical protein
VDNATHIGLDLHKQIIAVALLPLVSPFPMSESSRTPLLRPTAPMREQVLGEGMREQPSTISPRAPGKNQTCDSRYEAYGECRGSMWLR